MTDSGGAGAEDREVHDAPAKNVRKIVAEPVETKDGLRYRKTKLPCPALVGKKPAPKAPSALGEGVAAGSTTSRWRALEDSNLRPLDS